MRIVCIVNPVSGRRDPRPMVDRIGGLARSGGASFEVHLSAGPGDAARLAARHGRNADAILVAGGDGTVSEVIHGLGGAAVPIAILPTGTENLFARTLGMPSDADSTARLLLHGTATPNDVGEINGRLFVAVAGVGFDAECVARTANARRGHITQWDYFWPIWRVFWSHRFPMLQVELDGKRIFAGRGFALLGLISRYSIGLSVFPAARVDDGMLDVCVFPCDSRRRLSIHALRLFLRRHTREGGAVYRQGCEVSIGSPEGPVPVEIDGDPGGFLPLRARIRPGAASFLRDPARDAVSQENA